MNLLIPLLIFILTSCGKKINPTRNDDLFRDYDQTDVTHHYRGVLRPINNHLSGFLPSGIAEVIIKKKIVGVKTLLDDDAKVIHIQSIHTGNTCPDLNDDLNSDTYIDINEAAFASGEMYIPLDGDINTERLGAGNYPMGGNFTYAREASLQRLSNDLASRGHVLDFRNKVVIIYGTYKKNNLPPTIATLGISPVEKSLPIACGVLKEFKL